MGQDGGLCKTHPNLGEVWIQALMAGGTRPDSLEPDRVCVDGPPSLAVGTPLSLSRSYRGGQLRWRGRWCCWEIGRAGARLPPCGLATGRARVCT